jgi:hypothetical protein
MSINLDQTGPSHLLSTDEDGLILNGSPVISKSIHVSNIPPQNLKLLWLDTTQPGVSAFPTGGSANYILRTDGSGNVSWVPPSSLDVTRYRYYASTLITTSAITFGEIRFNDATMSDATNIYIAKSDAAENDLSEFFDSLNLFGNSVRRGYIKVEKQNDPNWFLIFQYKELTNYTDYYEITVEIARTQGNFTNEDPVYVTFAPSGPEGLPQDLSIFVTLTGVETVTNKTFTNPTISGLFLSDSNITFEGATTNAYQTTLTVVDPTNDRTVTIPDASTILVGDDTEQTLTNKTLTEPYIDDPIIRNTLTFQSNAVTESPFYLVANSLNENVGLLRLEGREPDIALNQTSMDNGGYNTLSFEMNGDPKFALGRTGDNNFYITRKPAGTWIDDTLVIDFNSGDVTIGSTSSSTSKSTGSLMTKGGLGVDGAIYAGSVQATPIGSAIRSSGYFTELRANNLVRFTSDIESTDSTTGAVTITGGLGIGKNLSVDGTVYAGALDPSETLLTGYNMVVQGPNAKLRIGPNYTAGGDRDYIDFISTNTSSVISTNNENFVIENTRSASEITLTATDGSVIISAFTPSVSNDSGALRVTGGLGVQGEIYANDIFSDNSQVVTLVANQTIENKTLINPTIEDIVITGSVTANGTTGINGQYLQTTGTGVTWVNQVTTPTYVYTKNGDQTTTASGAIVAFSSTASLSSGASFGSMNNDGTFTFDVAGSYYVTVNYNLGVSGGGGGYAQSDFWLKINGSSSPRYLQLNSSAMRRGSVSDFIVISNPGDNITWWSNTALIILGTGNTASKITIMRIS